MYCVPLKEEMKAKKDKGFEQNILIMQFEEQRQLEPLWSNYNRVTVISPHGHFAPSHFAPTKSHFAP